MSNIVKWNYVNFDNNDKLLINAGKRKEIYGNNNTDDIMKGLQIQSPQDIADAFKSGNEDSDFHQGINIINYDTMMEEEKKRIAVEADSLISNAKEEAERLIQEAIGQGENIKNEAFEQGKNEGYEVGFNEGQSSVEIMKNQLKTKEAELMKEKERVEQVYLEKLEEVKNFFGDMIGTLVEKITGVVTSDRKDVILYLLEKGIGEAGSSERFALRVSPEDINQVEDKKEQLVSVLKEGTTLEIILDEQLEKNQCMIETDTKIIDTSLDVQLRTLMENLRIMSASSDMK